MTINHKFVNNVGLNFRQGNKHIQTGILVLEVQVGISYEPDGYLMLHSIDFGNQIITSAS